MLAPIGRRLRPGSGIKARCVSRARRSGACAQRSRPKSEQNQDHVSERPPLRRVRRSGTRHARRRGKATQGDQHFDPYSDTPDEDYETLRETVARIDVAKLQPWPRGPLSERARRADRLGAAADAVAIVLIDERRSSPRAVLQESADRTRQPLIGRAAGLPSSAARYRIRRYNPSLIAVQSVSAPGERDPPRRAQRPPLAANTSSRSRRNYLFARARAPRAGRWRRWRHLR
jgi:hypothetical protein